MKAGIAGRRSGVTSALAFGLLVLTATARGQGLVEDFNAASGTGGATVFSGSGFNQLDGWDDGLVGEWAYGGTFGDGIITSVDAYGSLSTGVGGTGAGVLQVTGASYVDGGWFAGLVWPDLTPPVLDPAGLQLTADIMGSVPDGAYQLRLEGYNLVPFGLNENFDTVEGDKLHVFFDPTSPFPWAWMENWDQGISGEEAFAGFNGGGTVNGGVTALGVTNGGIDGSGAGQLIVEDLVPDPGGSWYAGFKWPGQILPTTDLTQVKLTANIKGEINGGTLGDYMLRLEDADIDFLAFKVTATGDFQDVGGWLSTAVEDGVGNGDGLFDPTKEPLSVVVVFDNDISDTWGSGGKITVDNLQLTGGEHGVLLGSVSFNGIADGSTFQPIGGVLSSGTSTFVNVNEDFEDVVGPDATGGVFFDSTSVGEGYTPNWDEGIEGESAVVGVFGAVQVNGDARALGVPTGGTNGSGGGRLRVTGLNVQGGCAFSGWWGSLIWANQHMPDGALADVILLANVKGTAVSGGTAGAYTLRIEDADLDYLSFTLPSNGQFRTIGGALLTTMQGGNATEGGLGGQGSDGVFDRTHGPFTVVVAFDDPCTGWGPGGQLDVDNVTLTQAAFGAGVDLWSVAVSFIDEMASWDTGGTLTVDNLGLTEFTALAPAPLVAVDAGNRYLRVDAPPSVTARGVPVDEAIRVRFVDLDGYDEPPDLYVGSPTPRLDEDSSYPGQTFNVAPLVCSPVFRNWSGDGSIGIHGAEILPGSTFIVQRAFSSCPDLSDEGCWSDPVELTTSKYGDVWDILATEPKRCQKGPNDGELCDVDADCADDASCTGGICKCVAPPPQPDFNDISALVRKFQSSGSKCNAGPDKDLACGTCTGPPACLATCTGTGTCAGGHTPGAACLDDDDCPNDGRTNHGVCIRCARTAPHKSAGQLQPNSVFPARPIDFRDIAADVASFTGATYADINFGPCVCPSIVTCGAQSCTTDSQCFGFGDGFCVDGFCTDKCGRCAPTPVE